MGVFHDLHGPRGGGDLNGTSVELYVTRDAPNSRPLLCVDVFNHAAESGMSGSVTPARRPREDDESEAGSFESSVDGEGTPRSNVAKRARLDNNDSEGDGSPEVHFQYDFLYTTQWLTHF